jgi:hypothetical protein
VAWFSIGNWENSAIYIHLFFKKRKAILCPSDLFASITLNLYLIGARRSASRATPTEPLFNLPLQNMDAYVKNRVETTPTRALNLDRVLERAMV